MVRRIAQCYLVDVVTTRSPVAHHQLLMASPSQVTLRSSLIFYTCCLERWLMVSNCFLELWQAGRDFQKWTTVTLFFRWRSFQQLRAWWRVEKMISWLKNFVPCQWSCIAAVCSYWKTADIIAFLPWDHDIPAVILELNCSVWFFACYFALRRVWSKAMRVSDVCT